MAKLYCIKPEKRVNYRKRLQRDGSIDSKNDLEVLEQVQEQLFEITLNLRNYKEDKDMMKMKLNKKIAGATAMLMVSATMLGTSTFAWFTMNKSVEVTGMEMKTVVSSNLQIDDAAPTNGGSWSVGSWATNDNSFRNSTQQQIVNEVLVPVSTVDGYSYWFTDPDNVLGNGDAVSDAYTSYTLAGLQAKYGNTVTHGYLDYHFILKATNTTDADQKIVLNKLDLTYTPNGSETDTDKAWRVAVLGKEFTTATVNGAKTLPDISASGATVTKIYTPADAANFTAGKAVNSATGLANVTYASAVSDSEIFTVAANSTKYYEVVMRVWIEGEDTTCYTGLFNDLQKGKWTLDTGFALGASGTAESGVYNITMH